MVKFANAYKGFADAAHYSFFEELYKVKSKHPEAEFDEWQQNFFRWIREGKFDAEGAKDVRYLSKVLQNPRIKEIFELQGMKAARFELAKTDFEVAGNSALVSVQQATDALRGIRHDEFNEIVENQSYDGPLKELREEVDKLLHQLKIIRE